MIFEVHNISSKTLGWGDIRRIVFDMLVILLQTMWENKEKMVQHIMVIVVVKSV
jgi:hypothetical protein